jgi:hypothetical protein
LGYKSLAAFLSPNFLRVVTRLLLTLSYRVRPTSPVYFFENKEITESVSGEVHLNKYEELSLQTWKRLAKQSLRDSSLKMTVKMEEVIV